MYSPDYECAPEEEMNWYSSLQGHIGIGSHLAVGLKPGEHVISLVGPDGEGRSLTRSEYRIYVQP